MNANLAKASEESMQRFTNLLKASWIMNDVVRQHPQRPFITAGHRQAPIASLANAINAELEDLKSSVHIPLSMDLIVREGNFEIFDDETLARFGAPSIPSALPEPNKTTRPRGVVVHESPIQWGLGNSIVREESILTVTSDAENNKLPVMAISIEGLSGDTFLYGMFIAREMRPPGLIPH